MQKLADWKSHLRDMRFRQLHGGPNKCKRNVKEIKNKAQVIYISKLHTDL